MGPSRTAARRVDRPTSPGLAEGATKKKSGLRIPGFAQLQRLGKSLMLPIALLPAAGILLRLGSPICSAGSRRR